MQAYMGVHVITKSVYMHDKYNHATGLLIDSSGWCHWTGWTQEGDFHHDSQAHLLGAPALNRMTSWGSVLVNSLEINIHLPVLNYLELHVSRCAPHVYHHLHEWLHVFLAGTRRSSAGPWKEERRSGMPATVVSHNQIRLWICVLLLLVL